ncbi:hypothetical protein D051_0048 [Vibrio parahaemolyticus VPCR-2010]|nr:hypothetical protein D051_0048 [Vibrio parahaemolyticus VPCR-2010]
MLLASEISSLGLFAAIEEQPVVANTPKKIKLLFIFILLITYV